ncbi:hypothetical protein GYA27_04020 [candidate division WWE3 bacterium]|uniref:Uncharacterized protein n=1 Tax=candidate division WWE3 bacterium TaxID=2053526 RepID=A0A7X9DL95_UNCKA|nr:hypothetical protein [candidate division WWE3 bacterium]
MPSAPITIYIVNYKGRKSILYAVIVILLIVGVLIFILPRIPKKFQISTNKNSQIETSKSSPFASFTETPDSANTKTDIIYTKEFTQNLKDKALKMSGMIALPDFVDSLDDWKGILKSGQHLAKVECLTGNLKLCNLDFIASSIPDFTSKYYSEVSLTRTCPLVGTVYLVDDRVLSYSDTVSLESYLDRSIKLIATFDTNENPFKQDSLPKAVECIYYVK